MVVFTNGVSDKGQYRKFKMTRQQNDDFYNMHETITRRLSDKNMKAWGKPDLFLIDGGKGQLDAALRARAEFASRTDPDAVLRQGPSLTQGSLMPMIGLAKREEQIVIKKEQRVEGRGQSSSEVGSNVTLDVNVLHKLGGYTTETDDFILVNLPHSTNLVKLLQRIRDESHRFAVSYHSTLKVKQQTSSMLDDIPTIGPVTRKKLIKTFGSVRGVMQARDWELAKIVGEKKAILLRQYLRPLKKADDA
jgi:excinuclease ABC subunit C